VHCHDSECAAIAVSASGTALAQQRGGVLTMFSLDSPPSMSIHEEATPASQAPMMGVFNKTWSCSTSM